MGTENTQKKQSKSRELFMNIRNVIISNDVLWENEIQANRIVAFTMANCAIIMIVLFVLNILGVVNYSKTILQNVVIQGIPELVIPIILCVIFKYKKKWLKVVLLIEFTVVMARVDSMVGYNATLIMLLPVILSVLYYSRPMTVIIAVLTSALFLVSAAYQALWAPIESTIDNNFVFFYGGITLQVPEDGNITNAIRALGDGFDRHQYFLDYLKMSYLPRFLIFSIGAILCTTIADRGKKLIFAQAEISKKTTRIESELSLATNIQKNMLPCIFPPFPDHDECDIYASMTPAKEVGGDFYDFYMLDDTHLGFIIADVSGKGVPAALFMVVAKTLVQNQAQMNEEVNSALKNVNRMLCEKNDAGLFVTAWLGVLDLKTGRLTFANAGHNPPLLKTEKGNTLPDGSMAPGNFDFLRSKAGFVLAGMEGYPYKEFSVTLKPGDTIFLYTDGVTEATSAETVLFGEDRLKNHLNNHLEDSAENLIKTTKEAVDAFVGQAEQFDDITMLAIKFKKYAEENNHG